LKAAKNMVATLRARLRELAAVRRRFGYRRLLILLRREGTRVNQKKLRRLYREERLQVRRAADAKERLEQGLPWHCRKIRTSAGHSTF